MTDVYDVLDEAFPGAVESGPLGVTVGPLRVYSGSGIAGHSQEWWIDFPGCPCGACLRIGPITTRRRLRWELRKLTLRLAEAGQSLAWLAGYTEEDR